MNRVPLPIPGVILGAWPERKLSEDAYGSARIDAFWAGLPFVEHARQRQLAATATRISIEFERLREHPGRASGAHLLQLRAELSRDGFISATAERCSAMVMLAIEATFGRRLRPNQIMAAHAVLRGGLAEVPTGEGKTLATALAACIAALAGVPVHVITSNDYLAARDAAYLQPLAHRLGLQVSAIAQDMSHDQRRAAYGAHITYTCSKELVFDYLRDSLLPMPSPGTPASGHQRVLRGLCMAIIDEADSVLLDDAATPFILSETSADPVQAAVCALALRLASRMRAGFDFRIDHRSHSVDFTADGQSLLMADPEDVHPLWAIPRYREEMVELALRALHILQRDKDYLVQDGKVSIIDSNSGRLAAGRAWSRGLHQMVEIKERCKPTPATRVLAQITFQRFFPRYLLLGGMSGTLVEARHELLETYHLNVLRIPTGRPSGLRVLPPLVAKEASIRWQKMLTDIANLHAQGRPVLVGTDSVKESDRVSRLLTQAELPHRVLNARQDCEEAELISAAGRAGAITVTTNMAGRGTDIIIDETVAKSGGLHVVSCQHNSSRRIDRQLFGRAGRLGQPGSAQTLLSLEEGLLGRTLPSSLQHVLQLFSSTRGFMPLVVGGILLRITQYLEERRGRLARQHLREADARQQERQLFGARPE